MRSNTAITITLIVVGVLLLPCIGCGGWLTWRAWVNRPVDVAIEFQQVHIFWLEGNTLRHGTISANRAFREGGRLHVEMNNRSPYELTPGIVHLRFYSGRELIGEDTGNFYKAEWGASNKLIPYATTTLVVECSHPAVYRANKVQARLTDIGDAFSQLLWTLSGVKVDKFRLRDGSPAVLIRNEKDRAVSMYEMESIVFRP